MEIVSLTGKHIEFKSGEAKFHQRQVLALHADVFKERERTPR